MDDLRQLYQDIVSDHFRNPGAKGWEGEGWVVAEQVNPACGDLVRMACRVDEQGRLDFRQETRGCAASTASASIVCRVLSGCGVEEALTRCRWFLDQMGSPVETGDSGEMELDALLFFRRVPARVVCVSLAWKAALALLATEEFVGKHSGRGFCR